MCCRSLALVIQGSFRSSCICGIVVGEHASVVTTLGRLARGVACCVQAVRAFVHLGGVRLDRISFIVHGTGELVHPIGVRVEAMTLAMERSAPRLLVLWWRVLVLWCHRSVPFEENNDLYRRLSSTPRHP